MSPARIAGAAIRALVLAAAVAAGGGAGLGGCGSSPAAPDASPPHDGGDLESGDAACNALVQLGAPVTPVCDAGTAPVPAGGTIADGTYVLTESHFFGACSAALLAETIVVAQGTVQSIATPDDGGAGAQAKTVTYTLGSNGKTLALTQTCPSRILTTVSFTATPTTLTISLVTALATRVSTFTLQ